MLTETDCTHTPKHTYNNLRKEGRERGWGNGRIDGLMYKHNGTQPGKANSKSEAEKKKNGKEKNE